MKYIVIIALTLAAWLAMQWKKKYRGQIFGGFVIVMMILSLIYNVRIMNGIVPFYRPVNQTFYQTEFLEKGEYPDSLLPLLLKGKTVYTKDDRISMEQAVSEGKNWLYAYYHNENALNYLELIGAIPVKDAGLNASFIDETEQQAFADLGYANDMFRYTFLCNDFWEEIGNYFTYYWYYSDYMSELHVYINSDGMEQCEEFVVLWDGSAEKEAENLYIMTKAYYESEVAKENAE